MKKLLVEQQKMRLRQRRKLMKNKPFISGLSSSERCVVRELISIKAQVYRNGWPDFLVRRGEKFVAIEVKLGKDNLSDDQLHMHAALKDAGVSVETVYTDRANWKALLRSIL